MIFIQLIAVHASFLLCGWVGPYIAFGGFAMREEIQGGTSNESKIRLVVFVQLYFILVNPMGRNGRLYFTPTSVTRSRFRCQLRWVHFSGPPHFGPLVTFLVFFC